MLISVVSYHSLDLVTHFLRKVLGLIGAQPCQIVLSVNDEAPLSPIAIEALRHWIDHDELVIAPWRGNIGFGAAHQAVYDRLKEGDWLWCANPDIAVDRYYLEKAEELLSQLPDDVLVASPPVRDEAGLHQGFSRPVGLELVRFVLGCGGLRLDRRDHALPKSPVHVDGVPGALFAVRKSQHLPEPFDPEVFLFYEERVLAEKVYRARKLAVILPLEPVAHDRGQSRRHARSSLVPYFTQAQQIYCRKYLQWPSLAVIVLDIITRARLRISKGV